MRHGADVNYVNMNGETPLIAAANNGKIANDKNLQKKFANRKIKQKHLFHLGDSGAVRILCLSGANVNHENIDGNTALHTAVYYGELDNSN